MLVSFLLKRLYIRTRLTHPWGQMLKFPGGNEEGELTQVSSYVQVFPALGQGFRC